MSYRIRPVEPEDAPAWRALWADYLAFYGERREKAVFDTTWARILDPAVPMHARVAETEGGELVGLVHFLHHLQFWGPEERIYLQDLYTVEKARGMGVGRALIAAVTEHARRTGAERVWWLTAEDNAAARALYDKVARLTSFRQYVTG